MFFSRMTRIHSSPEGSGEKRLIVLTALSFLALIPSCVRRVGHSSVPDSDVLITGGKETSSFPAVVQLKTPAGTTCTGTFISDQILLTAAHCFKDQSDKATIGAVSSLKIRIHPKYTHSQNNKLPITESAFDIALVQFPPKTGKSSLALTKASAKSGDKVVLVGYGSTKSDSLDISSTKRTGSSQVKDNVRGVLIIAGSSGSTSPVAKVSTPSIVPKADEKASSDVANSSVGPGDSGGPLLSADGKEILGVTSSVAASEGPVSFAMFADVGSTSSQDFFKKAAVDGMFPSEQLPASNEPVPLPPMSEPPRVETQATPPLQSNNSPNSHLPAPPEEVVRSLKALGANRVYTVAWNCRDMRDESWFIGPSVIYADRKHHFLWTCNLDNPLQFVIRGDCDKGLDSSSEILRCRL
jgi:Trypsin